MRRKLTLATSLALVSIQLFGQCPTPGFTIGSAGCANQSVSFTNTSSGATSYEWDFCGGDFDAVPIATNLGLPFLNPLGITPVFDGSNWFAFVNNDGDGSIVRLDFGSSLMNVPATTNLGNIGGEISAGLGRSNLELVNEGGNWYGLLACQGNAKLIRYDFGNSLTNVPTSTSTVYAQLGSSAFFLNAIQDNGNLFLFIANTNASIEVFNYGSSITNTPTTSTISVPGASLLFDVDIVKDCDQWIGFASSYSASAIFRLDFGTALTNAPTVSTLTPVNSLVSFPQNVKIGFDGKNWGAMVQNSSGAILCLNFGSDLSNTSPLCNVLSLTGYSSSGLYLSMVKDGSTFYLLTSNFGGNTCGVIQLNNDCGANPATSTLQNPSCAWSSGGTKYVSLKATDASGNTQYYTDSITINFAPQTAFNATALCFGDATQFMDSSQLSQGTITAWDWDFGDLNTSTTQNPVNQYATSGTFVVTLVTTASSGCSDTLQRQIYIGPKPIVSFSSGTACAGTLIPFTDQSTIPSGTLAAWTWMFGNGDSANVQNPSYVFPVGGTFDVVLTVTSDSGCTDSASTTLNINFQPEAFFTESNTCVGQSVQFIDATNSQSPIQSYAWDFGDGNTDTQVNPQHTYPAIVANYFVNLIVTASNGCIDTIQKDIKINTIPTADFTITNVNACQNNQVQFQDLSSVSGDTLSGWYWDFGDNTFDSIPNPVHTFTTSGPNIVRLIVYSPSSCPSAMYQQTIDVVESPVASFTFTDVCLGNTTQFNNISLVPSGSTIDSTSWDFGTGDFSGAPNTAFYTYDSAATFPVALTVITNFGCIGTDTLQVPVHSIPTAAYTFSNPCSGQAVVFNNQSTTDSLSSLANFTWNFGDFGNPNNISNLVNPTHTYSTLNTYSVFLIATTNFGCSDTTVDTVQIFPSAPSQFTYSPTCDGDLMEFFNPGSSLDSAYLWNFGDNQTNQLQEPAHFYAFPGTYTVTLTVYAFSGCASTSNKQVTVSPIPVADFKIQPICVNNSYQFQDSSSINNGSILHWDWSIAGVASLDTVQNPSYTFADTGTYAVTLMISSDIGCTNSITQAVHVYPLPTANFSFDPQFGNPPLDVQFTDFSTGGSFYQWEFGDNSTGSSTHEPSHIYQDTGIFVIHQYVTNAYGCIDSVEKSIYVIKPVLDIAITGDSSYVDGNYFYVVARIANQGTREINKVNMEARLEDGTTIKEKYESLIPNGPAGIQSYSFKAAFLISANSNFNYYCVKANDPNGETDNVQSNNERCFNRTSNLAIVNPYPNPFTDVVSVRVVLPFEDNVSIDLFDFTGKIISNLYTGAANKGLLEVRSDLSGLSDGVYSIRIQFRDEEQTRRIVKQTPKN
ncbi:MAG: PKD domain-containing protein [Bacteroidetes bacterium]|nr:PKD domain-containing protein [Bacteroidota bacterium]